MKNVLVVELYIVYISFIKISYVFGIDDRSDVTADTAIHRHCPVGEWWNGKMCQTCTQRCPRFTYISSNCTETKDVQCSLCYYTKRYEDSAFGDKEIVTWQPLDVRNCKLEYIIRVNQTPVIDYIAFAVVLLVGIVVHKICQ